MLNKTEELLFNNKKKTIKKVAKIKQIRWIIKNLLRQVKAMLNEVVGSVKKRKNIKYMKRQTDVHIEMLIHKGVYAVV